MTTSLTNTVVIKDWCPVLFVSAALNFADVVRCRKAIVFSAFGVKSGKYNLAQALGVQFQDGRAS